MLFRSDEKTRYVTVNIPAELAVTLDRRLREMGHHSRAEMVDDAMRRFIESKTKIEFVIPGVPG